MHFQIQILKDIDRSLYKVFVMFCEFFTNLLFLIVSLLNLRRLSV